MEIKGIFQFEIFIDVLVSSVGFIGIPMLPYKYVHSYNTGIDFRRQNRTSVDVR